MFASPCRFYATENVGSGHVKVDFNTLTTLDLNYWTSSFYSNEAILGGVSRLFYGPVFQFKETGFKSESYPLIELGV